MALPGGALAAGAPAPFWKTCERGPLFVQAGGECDIPRGIGADATSGHLFVADSVNRRIQELTAWGDFVMTGGWGVAGGGAAGSGDLVAGSTTVSGVQTTAKAFQVGQAIEGEGIPAGTRVGFPLGDGTMTLTQPATETAAAVALTAPESAGNVPVNERQRVTIGAGVTAGTFKLRFTTPNPSPSNETSAAIDFDASAGQLQGALEALANIGVGNVAASGPAGGPWTVEFQGARFADTNVAQLAVAAGEPPLVGGGASVATIQQGAAVFEVCPDAPNCLDGQGGSGNGQLNSPQAVAVDSAGAVYAVDFSNRRVQKFSADGDFLLMFGGQVNKTKVEEGAPEAERNRCPVDPGDECQQGVEGAGKGQFGAWAVGSIIAVVAGSPDRIYVGDVGRIQRFDPDGVFQAETKGAVAEETVQSLAADSAGNLWVSFSQGSASKANVLKMTPAAGFPLCQAAVGEPRAIAADPAGGAYVIERQGGLRVRHFEADCTEAEPSFGQAELAESSDSTGIAASSACHTQGAGIYLSSALPLASNFVQAFGPPPDRLEVESCRPVPRPPEILAQYTSGVDTESATLRATINPRQWADATYFAQLATAACVEAGGWEAPCVSDLPSPPAPLGGGPVDAGLTASVFAGGLQPGTAYRYRFVAQSGGDPSPVIGQGGKPGEEGTDAAFTTYVPPTAEAACPNRDLRVGAGAALPDCRAYELVSPLDKDGGNITAKASLEGELEAAWRQSAPNGDSLTYTSQTAFAGAQRGSLANQYLSRRGDGGWSTGALNPPQGTTIFDPEMDTLYDLSGNNFRAFSADLCLALLRDHNLEPLRSDALVGHTNLYLRENCGAAAGGYLALTRAPLAFATERQDLQVNYGAFSRDGRHVVFGATAALEATPAASAADVPQLYGHDRASGQLRLVSVLPGGEAAGGGAGLGSAPSGSSPREGSLSRAVAADGSRIFWTSAGGDIYVRVGGTQSLPVASGARFLTAAVDGSRAIYRQGDQLFEFDVEAALGGEAAVSPIAGDSGGVVGASEDLSHLYFTSREALAAGAAPGGWNLYLRRGGGEGAKFTHVATVSEQDRGQGTGEGSNTAPTVDGAAPISNSSRVTPDGRRLVFMSNRSLTGYDNADAATGEAASEVYRYDAESEQLRCVSCNPTGARPRSELLRGAYRFWSPGNPQHLTHLRAAAWIPTCEWAIYCKRSLSEDGDRVYFNAHDAIALRDTNGAQDVYQWEAPGTGGCDEDDADYFAANGGCVSLISTGIGESDSEFLDASASGRDVFFISGQSIDPRDPGSIDVYDARELGGFPPPPPPEPECVGDACQSAPEAPQPRTPASAVFQGPGNLPKGRDCGARGRRAARLSRRAKGLRRAARRSTAPRRSKRLRRRATRSARQAKRLSRSAKRCRAANRRAGR